MRFTWIDVDEHGRIQRELADLEKTIQAYPDRFARCLGQVPCQQFDFHACPVAMAVDRLGKQFGYRQLVEFGQGQAR